MNNCCKRLLSVFICVTLLFAIISCQKQERDNNIAKQESQIDTYIENQTSDSVIFNNGVYRIIKSFGSGAEAERGIQSIFIMPYTSSAQGKVNYMPLIEILWQQQTVFLLHLFQRRRY